MLIWLLTLAYANPLVSDVPWLPFDTEMASVRLNDGVDPLDPDVAQLLSGGRSVGEEVSAWIDEVLAEYPSLTDPRRIWRVATHQVGPLRQAGLVEQAWGLPAPAPPPADIPPPTPDFDHLQDVFTLPPLGAGVWFMQGWLGGRGAGIVVVDVEYDFDVDHEDLQNNAPQRVSGNPAGQWDYHGNAVLGLVGAADDGFGVTGAVPEADLRVVHPHRPHYDVADAMLSIGPSLWAGDVLLIEQQFQTTVGLGPVTSEPGAWSAASLLVEAGIVVVEPAGNGSVDLDDEVFGTWFSEANDSGTIMVGAANHVDGSSATFSTYGSRVDVHVRVGHLHAPSSDEFEPDLFFPDQDRRQAYTSLFSGTSGASAVVAGVCAGLQGIHIDARGRAATPRQLRAWLQLAGRSRVLPSTLERQIGVPVDAARVIQLWLAP